MTHPSTVADTLAPVRQSDRRAAVDMLNAMWSAQHINTKYPWMRDEESATLNGKRDDAWAVQSFVRYRLNLALELAVARGEVQP